jgi:Domain of unknown function (DUF6916)
MSDFQTEAEFAKHVDTNFRIELEESGHMDLKLVAVTPRKIEPHEQPGMERFSAVFSGPPDFFLPQQTYHMSHPEMGEFDVFLVAIGREADGFRYEAVYNYYRQD